MYGEEYGSILGKGVCSRCDSTTRLRGLQRTGTNIIVCHAVCNKCHLVKLVGFTSTNEIAHAAVKQKLEKMMEAAESPIAKQKIAQKIQYLNRTKDLHDLGL